MDFGALFAAEDAAGHAFGEGGREAQGGPEAAAAGATARCGGGAVTDGRCLWSGGQAHMKELQEFNQHWDQKAQAVGCGGWL